jgi:hypothetical protein
MGYPPEPKYVHATTDINTPGICPHCGYGHIGTCPKIKAIEYHQDGTVRRIEFHPVAPMVVPADDPVRLIRVPDAPSFTTGK